jgi:NADH-quinone oxidoreductase subunit I
MHVEYPKPRWSDKFLLLDMLEGLKTTFRELFKPKVTIRYPEERLEPANRFRGMFKFSFDRCIACKLCALACPIDIIYIDVHDEQREVDGKMRKLKGLDRYDIDVQRCMFCSLCEEACPTKPKSIWLTTKTYELATYDRSDLYFNMQQLEYWAGRPEYAGLPSEEDTKQIEEGWSSQNFSVPIIGTVASSILVCLDEGRSFGAVPLLTFPRGVLFVRGAEFVGAVQVWYAGGIMVLSFRGHADQRPSFAGRVLSNF